MVEDAAASAQDASRGLRKDISQAEAGLEKGIDQVAAQAEDVAQKADAFAAEVSSGVSDVSRKFQEAGA